MVAGLNRSAVLDPLSIPFYYGDTINLIVYLLTPNPVADPQSPKFSIIPTTGVQLFLYLDDGTIGGTIYTQQIAWSTDANSQYFFATLPINTAALQALMGSTQQQTVSIKIGYVAGGQTTTVFSQQIQIRVGLPNVALAVAPGLTALSQEVAKATYFPIFPQAGLSLLLMSPNGKQIAISVVDNPDGTASLQQSLLN